MRRLAPLLLFLLALAACGGSPADGAKTGAGSSGAPTSTTVAQGLRIPWEIAFLPDGGALITERPGEVVKLTADRKLQHIATIKVVTGGENGLLGLALDPDFSASAPTAASTSRPATP